MILKILNFVEKNKFVQQLLVIGIRDHVDLVFCKIVHGVGLLFESH